MFNLLHRKVNRKNIISAFGKAINVVLLCSLILTSCQPVNTIKPQGTVEPTPPPTQATDVPQQKSEEYEPPVFVQPEPRIAENIDNSSIQGSNGTNDSIENLLSSIPDFPDQPELPEEFYTQIEEATQAFEDAMRKLDSFVPPPNPVRKIKKTRQTKSENKPSAVRTSTISTTDNISEEIFLANPRRDNESGTTFVVTTLADTDDGTCDSDCSLREALYVSNDSAGMDTITFSISGTIQISGDPLPPIFDIAGLTLDGDGQTVTISEGGFFSNSGSPFILKKLIIENGYITNYGPLTISDSTLIYTSPYSESELIISNSILNISSTVSHGPITINNIILMGGSFYTTSDLTIIDTPISYGSAQSGQSLILHNSPITDGYAYSGSDLSISDSNFDDSWAYSEGNSIIKNSNFSQRDIYSEGTLSIDNGNLTNCYIVGGLSLTITNTTFSGQWAYSRGFFAITDSSFEKADAYSTGILTITNSPFINTKWVHSDTELSISKSIFTNSAYVHSSNILGITNSAIFGGYVQSNNEATYTNSTFTNNRILNAKLLTISGETIFNNVNLESEYTSRINIDYGSLIISNSTLQDCVSLNNKGTLTSTNNTFYKCPIVNSSNLILNNTILASGSTCTGNDATGRNNLLETSGAKACGLHNEVNGNIVEYSAYLGVPKGNSMYIPLSPSSSAIDAGDDTICAAEPVNNTSQNGLTRPQDGHCDIGAYEVGPAPIVNDDETISDCNGDCPITKVATSQGKAGGPINTRTGGYQYNIKDISISTTAGELTFTRDYASLGVGYATTLSPGWTNNQDTRLILPDDPDGKEGAILFKLHSSNLYPFYKNEYDLYSASPELLSTIVTYGLPTTYPYVITDSNQNVYKFDENGTLLSYSDPLSNSWDYSYDTSGLLERISANNGMSYLSFFYNLEGFLTSVVDQNERQVTYTYDNNADLIAVTDVLGQTWRYTYDSSHRLTNVLDPNGISLERTEYDEKGRAVRQFDGKGNLVVALTYNADRTTTITDALGNQSVHEYDYRGTLINETDATGSDDKKTFLSDFRPNNITDAEGSVTDLRWSPDGANLIHMEDNEGNQINIAYDELNNPTSVVNPLNYLTTYDYEGKLLTSVTDALNKETTYTYSPEGYLQSVTDPLGKTTSYTNNSLGQRTSMIDPSGNTWMYAYDEFGNQTSTTDPLGRLTNNTYDNAGRLIMSVRNYDESREQNEQNLWNIVTKYEYDSRGNQIAVTDTYDRTTHYEYNAAGRLIKTIDPAGNETTNTYNEAGQLVAVSDAMGHLTQYAYDESGRQISTTDPDGKVTQTVYNPDGTVASTIDALGNTTSYTYDSLNRVTATTNADGSTTTNTYDAAGNLIAVTDTLGGSIQYEYNALGALIKTTDPLGGITENFYDDNGRLIQTKDASGNTTTNSYNDAGQLSSQTDALGNVTSFEYDPVGRRVAVIDPAGNRTSYGFDSLDQLAAVTDPRGGVTYTEYDALGQVISRTDAMGNETTYAYDSLGRMTSQTDPLGNSTTFTYDNLGNQLTIRDALGHETSFAYDNNSRQTGSTDALAASTSTAFDALGRVISSTDALGRIQSNEYDAMGRVIKQTNAASAVTLFNYDVNGNILSTTDANGHSSSMDYDALGRMLSQTDANGLTSAFTYDAVGNRLSQTDGSGNQTRFEYDALNRQVQMVDPLGNITASSYDSKGNLVQKTDAKSIVTKYEYNQNGNLTAVVENYVANGAVDNQTNVRTEYTYDLNGNLLTIKDANGHTINTYTYDALNRVLTDTDTLGSVSSYTYDGAGNMTQKVDGNGVTTIYAYDAVNQLTKVDYPGTDQDVVFTYDAAGQRTGLADGVGSTTWTYNALGQPTAITDPFQKTVSYGYDAVGNKTALTYADGKTVNYAFDAGNRLSAVTDWQSLVTQYTYNNLNLVSNVALPNAVNTTYWYDAAGRVLSIQHASDQRELGSYTYTYDPVGNRTRVVEKYLTGQQVVPVIAVTVKDTQGTIQPGVSVYAINGTTYTGFSAITDAQGVAKFILPEGGYRFRTDKNGLQYFSSPTNDCMVMGCNASTITIPIFTDVSITVTDSTGAPQSALPVYAFTGTTYTGFNGITDELGIVTLKLPEGSYRFRADKNKEQFFSSATNACTTPECTSASISVPQFDNVIITVTNSAGLPQADLPVYAFNGATYTNYHAVTDTDGHAELLLREGDYRFRADLNGLQYFSAAENHCTVMGCESAAISVPVFGEVAISVTNSADLPQEGLPVYAFEGTTYKGFSGTTDTVGLVTLILPEGDYRFRTDLNGGEFFSSTENLCAVPACTTSAISVPQFENVTITVADTMGLPQAGLPVYAFDGTTYTGYNSTTDENGQVVLLLKEGSYRFRADFDGVQYFSAEPNHCTVMGCSTASISIPTETPTATQTEIPTETPTATPTDSATETPTATQTETPTETPTATQTETPTENPTNTPTEEPTPTPSETPVGLNLSLGKALASMINGSRVGSHILADETGTTVIVTVTDSTGAILGGQTVYVFDGTTYKNLSGISDPNGQVVFTLADGSYRFRTDRFNRQYFSGAANTCSTPSCSADAIVVPVYGQVAITVKDSLGEIQSGLNVYAFNGTTYTGFSAVSGADGVALFNLPEGSYRFRADTHGLQYFSGTSNHCSVPACTAADITVPLFGEVSITVANSAGTAQANLPVYVFNGTTYTGFSARTDAAGIASLTLPEGNYRFRTDLNGTQYFSNTANHCAVPACTSAAIITPVYGSVTVSVLDSDNNVLAGLPVYVFNGTTYTGRSGTTNASGEVTLNLPEGNYRFRTDLNGQQYFSAGVNHCTVPECTTAQITAAVFGQVTVTVTDDAGTLQPDLPVYAFKGNTYTGFTGTTDANGQLTLNLPQGNYRFRADLHGAQYFSAEENTCSVPECSTVSVVTPLYGQVTITAQSGAGVGQADLPIYVFDETTYTGLSGVTGADGKVTLWIPAGSYRFRADQFDLQFFSGETNHCTVPECSTATVSTLGMQQVVTEQTIDYTYDPLNRLTGASYDDGSRYAYVYDAVGNRVSEINGSETNQYTYDVANRLASVNGQAYTYDANENLLSDGAKTYAYNYANRLTQVVSGADTYHYIYNGLGDRLKSILNGTTTTYSLDLNSGLTQVLADETNTYTYGFNRIAQVSETQTGYFLGDALGSVRQVLDPQAEILLAQSFSPYGEVLSTVGDFETAYSYTGEMTDGTGLINLRARYYDPGTGRFVSRDTWGGDYNNPVTLNKWLYANANPVLYIDPTGLYFWGAGESLYNSSFHRAQTQNVHIRIQFLAMLGQMDRIHAEFTSPLTYLPIDLLDSVTGEIWEIKPWADRNSAYAALDARIESLEFAKKFDLLVGRNPIGKKYDWNLNPPYWIEGNSFSRAVFIGTDETGYIQIWAGQVSPGVIAWWKFNSLIPIIVSSPILLTEQMKYSNRNVRSGWLPPVGSLNPSPQPAYNWDLNVDAINALIPLVIYSLLFAVFELCVLPVFIRVPAL